MTSCTHPEDLRGPLPYDGKPARADEWQCLSCGYVRDHDDDLSLSGRLAGAMGAFSHSALAPFVDAARLAEEATAKLQASMRSIQVVPTAIGVGVGVGVGDDPSSLTLTSVSIADALKALGATFVVDRNALLEVSFTKEVETDYRALHAQFNSILRIANAARPVSFHGNLLLTMYATDQVGLRNVAQMTQRYSGDWEMSPYTLREMRFEYDQFGLVAPNVGAQLFGRRVITDPAIHDGLVQRVVSAW